MKTLFICIALITLASCSASLKSGVYGIERKSSSFILRIYDENKCFWLVSGYPDAIGSECELEQIFENQYKVYSLEHLTDNKAEEMGTIEYSEEKKTLIWCLPETECIEFQYLRALTEKEYSDFEKFRPKK